MQKQYVLTGGRNGLREKNGWPLQVREVEAADGTLHEFVRISRQDHWFLKTIGGAGTQKGGLSHLTFLDELTEAAVAAAKLRQTRKDRYLAKLKSEADEAAPWDRGRLLESGLVVRWEHVQEEC